MHEPRSAVGTLAHPLRRCSRRDLACHSRSAPPSWFSVPASPRLCRLPCGHRLCRLGRSRRPESWQDAEPGECRPLRWRGAVSGTALPASDLERSGAGRARLDPPLSHPRSAGPGAEVSGCLDGVAEPPPPAEITARWSRWTFWSFGEGGTWGARVEGLVILRHGRPPPYRPGRPTSAGPAGTAAPASGRATGPQTGRRCAPGRCRA